MPGPIKSNNGKLEGPRPNKKRNYYNNRTPYYEVAAAIGRNNNNTSSNGNTKPSRNQIAIDRKNLIDNDNNVGFVRTGKTNDKFLYSPKYGNTQEGVYYDEAGLNETVESARSDTKTRVDYVANVSDPNALHDFASYATLFTLSGLSTNDLLNTSDLLHKAAHDIICQSGGIGPNANQDAKNKNFDATQTQTLKDNPAIQRAYNDAFDTLQKNRDLYINRCEIMTYPPANSQRRFTNATKIDIEISEPFGITLIERLRAAAANNGYLDHMDAPFLLTIKFQGFDEFGKPIHTAANPNKRVGANAGPNVGAMKRFIPIRIIGIDVNIKSAGSTYSLRCVPWNEMGFVDRYCKTRTAGTIGGKEKTMRELMQEFTKILNEQNAQELKDGLVGIQDRYEITISDKCFPDEKVEPKKIVQTGMRRTQGNLEAQTTEILEYMKFSKETSITQIIEEMMKGHPKYTNKDYKKWRQKVSKTMSAYGKRKSGTTAQDAYNAMNDKNNQVEFYFDYFQVTSFVEPIVGLFDPVRGTEAKIIRFAIEPLKFHAYDLAIPGVVTGDNFKYFVFKTYNYIFTGDNVDIMNVDLNFKTAYYQASLKKTDTDAVSGNPIVGIQGGEVVGTTAKDHFLDSNGTLHLKKEVTTVSNSDQGRTGEGTTELELFLDYITNPLADMVKLDLEILGDPAWIYQSSLMPKYPAPNGDGTHNSDKDTEFWRNGVDRIWNNTLRCYNADLATPIIMLNFRMPTDLNDKTGIYELQSEQSATFSGLYRVVSVRHIFDEGRYTNVLQLARFNNQSPFISNNVRPQYKVLSIDGKTQVVSQSEYATLSKTFKGKLPFVDIGRKIDSLIAKVQTEFKGIKKRASKIFKGFST